MLFIKGKTDTGKLYQRLSVVDVKGSTVLESFKAESKWFGEAIPDLGFVQLNVKQIPFLELAKEEFSLRPGMSIATVGFPMGDTPLTLFDRVSQMTPFVRRGIVSSVFPFSIAQPHGFTMDIMQQGGSSGSPVFREDSGVVVGMMASSVVDFARAQGDGVLLQIPQNTNLSIAVAASVIRGSLESFRSKYPWETEGVPTLEDLLRERPMREEIVWKPFGFSPSQ